jgi:hypothetical protein
VGLLLAEGLGEGLELLGEGGLDEAGLLLDAGF